MKWSRLLNIPWKCRILKNEVCWNFRVLLVEGQLVQEVLAESRRQSSVRCELRSRISMILGHLLWKSLFWCVTSRTGGGWTAEERNEGFYRLKWWVLNTPKKLFTTCISCMLDKWVNPGSLLLISFWLVKTCSIQSECFFREQKLLLISLLDCFPVSISKIYIT